MSSPVQQIRAEYDPEPRNALAARGVVRAALRDWGLDDLEPTASLLISEVSTNAVLHARTRFLLQVERRARVVRFTVFDCSPARPTRRRSGTAANGGRGLGLLEALASSWGTTTEPRPWTKGVWFELPTEPRELPTPQEGALLGGS